MNVVVTGGGTIAPVDDVRVLTNVSSGRFAAAITEAFLDRGASVWHVHAPAAQRPIWRHAALALDSADPAAELDRLASLREKWLSQRARLTLLPLEIGNVDDYAATLRRVLQSHPIDVVCLPMAVADFEVIRQVRDWAPAAYLVGFKLLSRAGRDQLLGAADVACRANRAQLTVANDLETLRAGRHTIHLVRPGWDPETLEPGPDLADRLVARIMAWSSLRSPHAGPAPSASRYE
jgi:hypothetical protein